MGKKKKKKKPNSRVGEFDEYLKVNKSLNRIEELERNGWRWVAKDRPHKNMKLYDRKRDRRIDSYGPDFFVFVSSCQ